MSNRALCIIRSSQGDKSKESLKYQREAVPDAARELVGDDGAVNVIDLGIHTGFSTFSRNPTEYSRELLDRNEEIQLALEDIEAGEFDYIVAKNRKRISRDEFFSIWKRAARLGDTEFYFVDGNGEDVDSLASEISHVVEKQSKQQEIQAAKTAKRRRKKQGLPDGRPPHGLMYNSDSTELIPHPEEIEEVKEVFRLRGSGASWREIGEETGVSKDTARRIYNEKHELYSKFLQLQCPSKPE